MNKILGKLLIALTITFMIPQLVFLYIGEDLPGRSTFFLLVSTFLLASIGCYLIWDIVRSIQAVFRGISDITKEEMKVETKDTEDEFRFLGNSIELISKRIVEDMESLQRSASLIEKTKKELSEALLYADNVMDSMGDALIVVDPSLRIKRMNPSAKRLLAFHVDNFLGQTLDLILDQNDLVEFPKTGLVEGKRMTFVTTKGDKIPVEVNIGSLLDPKQNPAGYVMVARDIRERLAFISRLKQMNGLLEETLQKKTADIEKAYEDLKSKDTQILLQEKMASIGMLTTGITHEINNPLGYISSNLEILQKDFKNILSYTQLVEYGLSALIEEESNEKRRQELKQFKQVRSEMKIETQLTGFGNMLKESRKGLDHIREVIADLKRFSATDSRDLKMIDLNDEMQITLNIVRHNLKPGTKIVNEFNPIPLIKGIPHQINQVFMNILVNALEAVGDDGTITIRTLPRDGSVCVTIQDSGPGISSEDLKKVFNPFFTKKPPGKGTGLGLYLSYDIIERHRGSLSVESTLGQGALFTIELPSVESKIQIKAKETVPIS
ncbi:MAG: ATP-binding protein [Nitrospiria bacterium]